MKSAADMNDKRCLQVSVRVLDADNGSPGTAGCCAVLFLALHRTGVGQVCVST